MRKTMQKKQIIKQIKKDFFSIAQPGADEYYLRSLLGDAIERTIRKEFEIIDHHDLLFLIEDDQEAVSFINETLSPEIEKLGDLGVVWAINCHYLCSDHRFHSPRVDYYAGEDSESYYYIVVSDSEPHIELKTISGTLEGLLEDLAPKHPVRAIRAIQDFLEFKSLDSVNILGTEIKPVTNYLIVTGKDFNKNIEAVIPQNELKKLKYRKGRDYEETIYFWEREGKIVSKYCSFWQASPDYNADFKQLNLRTKEGGK